MSLISRLLPLQAAFRRARLESGVAASVSVVIIAVAVALAVIALGGDGDAVAGPGATLKIGSEGVPGSVVSDVDAHSHERVVVKMCGESEAPDLRALGLGNARELGHDGTYVLEAEDGAQTDLTEVVDQVRHQAGVVWARTTAPRQPCLVPDDTVYGLQWGVPRVRLPEAWDLQTGSSEVIVAILDTGIDQYRADFAGRIVHPYSAVAGTTLWPEWRDGHGHGTAVASVAVAQGDDGQGMAGAAWNVKIMPVKIADDNAVSDDSLLADGIYWAVDHGADVINISFAGAQVTATEADAIRYAVERNVVVVAAAGNEASSFVWYPAGLPGVIAVGATAQSDSRADFSAMGDALDLAAPGKSIISWHVPTSSWTTWNGTSFSSPLVAGIAALVRSAEPGLTGAQVSAALTDSADDVGSVGWDPEFGWGVVDAHAALVEAADVAQNTTSSTTTSTTTTSTTLATTTSTTTTSTTTSSTTTTTSSTTTTTVFGGSGHFEDVSPDNSPYYEQIERLAALGIVSGKGDGLFYPDDNVLRQQFAKMIVKTLGYPVSVADISPFRDVEKNMGDLFPYHYVAVAWSKGITQGTDSLHFSPYGSLTRAQLITMVVRAAMLPEPPTYYQPPFANFSSVHYPYARRAAFAGLLDSLVGMGADYPFLASASREEVCGLLVELLEE